MFLNILHFFSGLFPRFSPARQRLAAIMRQNFRSLRAPITKRSVKARLLAAVKQQTGKLEFDELSNSRSLRLAHRQNASFRTSPQTGVGISIELWATHRHTDRSFVPFSGIYPREVVRLTGGLPRQCAHWLAMTGNSINSNFMICLLMPITLIPVCRVSGTLAFGYALPVSRRNMGVSMGFSKR